MYFIDWGDGIFDETGYYASGEDVIVSYIWSETGDFVIQAKAIDYYGYESEWTEFPVTMPKNKAINTPFLNYLQNHPILFQLLQKIFQRLG